MSSSRLALRIAVVLGLAITLAGCFQQSAQLRAYQADRDRMMLVGNREQR